MGSSRRVARRSRHAARRSSSRAGCCAKRFRKPASSRIATSGVLGRLRGDRLDERAVVLGLGCGGEREDHGDERQRIRRERGRPVPCLRRPRRRSPPRSSRHWAEQARRDRLEPQHGLRRELVAVRDDPHPRRFAADLPREPREIRARRARAGIARRAGARRTRCRARAADGARARRARPSRRRGGSTAPRSRRCRPRRGESPRAAARRRSGSRSALSRGRARTRAARAPSPAPTNVLSQPARYSSTRPRTYMPAIAPRASAKRGHVQAPPDAGRGQRRGRPCPPGEEDAEHGGYCGVLYRRRCARHAAPEPRRPSARSDRAHGHARSRVPRRRGALSARRPRGSRRSTRGAETRGC